MNSWFLVNSKLKYCLFVLYIQNGCIIKSQCLSMWAKYLFFREVWEQLGHASTLQLLHKFIGLCWRIWSWLCQTQSEARFVSPRSTGKCLLCMCLYGIFGLLRFFSHCCNCSWPVLIQFSLTVDLFMITVKWDCTEAPQKCFNTLLTHSSFDIIWTETEFCLKTIQTTSDLHSCLCY